MRLLGGGKSLGFTALGVVTELARRNLFSVRDRL